MTDFIQAFDRLVPLASQLEGDQVPTWMVKILNFTNSEIKGFEEFLSLLDSMQKLQEIPILELPIMLYHQMLYVIVMLCSIFLEQIYRLNLRIVFMG